MHYLLRLALSAGTLLLTAHASAQITLYERENFDGRSFTTQRPVGDFQRSGFNDRASSVIVQGTRWEVCDDARFQGRCAVLRPGQYPSLAAMGLNDRVSSVRAVRQNAQYNEDRYAPAPPPMYDARRRANERLYQADVTSVRAVVGPPEQRCWIEREQVVQEERRSNVPGAVIGAVIGGILGHQIGDGRGRDLATVGGAIAGGAVGTTVGRDGRPGPAQVDSVQRCSTVPSQARPELWDVGYNFRGQAHQMQMRTPPGPTVTVNRLGEPRV